MDESQSEDFLLAVQAENPGVIDLEEALTFALSEVREYDGFRWFGPIAGGSFYMDSNICLWYSETHTIEALRLMELEYGETLTNDLEYI